MTHKENRLIWKRPNSRLLVFRPEVPLAPSTRKRPVREAKFNLKNYTCWNAISYIHNLLTVMWSTRPSTLTYLLFLGAYVSLRSSLNSQSLSSRIRLSCPIICEAFKSQGEWSNAQRVSVTTTIILPTTAGKLHRRNNFSYVIDVQRTCTYQNIAKLLTHPSRSDYQQKMCSL